MELADLRALLQTGDRRTLGHVEEVVRLVLGRPELMTPLVSCAFDPDAGVRMRAADALEKASRVRRDCLQPYVGVLLGLFEETEQAELRWHLAVILPRLRLSPEERERTLEALERCLDAESSLAKTFALQGMADLAREWPSLLPVALDRLRQAERTGTAAMKARSRKLLRALEQTQRAL